MATYSDLELWAVVSAIYYDRNEIVTYPTGETRGHVQEAVIGLQAELLHTESIEEGEDVGQPGEVFITPRDILEATTYTSFIKFRRVALAEQVCERHSQTSSTTCSLLKPR